SRNRTLGTNPSVHLRSCGRSVACLVSDPCSTSHHRQATTTCEGLMGSSPHCEFPGLVADWSHNPRPPTAGPAHRPGPPQLSAPKSCPGSPLDPQPAGEPGKAHTGARVARDVLDVSVVRPRRP